MKKFILFSTLILSSLTSMVQAQEKLPKSAQALPSPKIEANDISFSGVALYKPFGGIPECPFIKGKDGKLAYDIQLSKLKLCYMRETINPNTKIDTEAIILNSAHGEMPFYVKNMTVSLIDGIVHHVALMTKGTLYQKPISKDLLKQFGKPQEENIIEAKDNTDTKVEVTIQKWILPNKIEINYIGAYETMDEGYIIALTPEFNAKMAEQKNSN